MISVIPWFLGDASIFGIIMVSRCHDSSIVYMDCMNASFQVSGAITFGWNVELNNTILDQFYVA